MTSRLTPNAEAKRGEGSHPRAETRAPLSAGGPCSVMEDLARPISPSLVSESTATRAGYSRRFRFAGPASLGYVQEVETNIDFVVREGEREVVLVSYRGAYPELLFGEGLDLHSLQVWREGWDQRGIRTLLQDRLPDPQPALDLLASGDPSLRVSKEFRVALVDADPSFDPNWGAGYLPGADPARLTLYHPDSPLVLEPPAYPAGANSTAVGVQRGPWSAFCRERFSYDFATCAAELYASPYSSTREVIHA